MARSQDLESQASSSLTQASTPEVAIKVEDAEEGAGISRENVNASGTAPEVEKEPPPPIEEPVSKVVSVNNVGAIPNGGLVAWLQVAGAFFLFFNSWGIVNAFGVFQTFYEGELLQDSTPSAISWIGSIEAFLLMLVGALTGPIYDAGYFRELLWAGSFLVTFGLMMLSICKEYWQVLLAQAFCVGFGTGCLFVPSVAILSTYFTTHIATAMGLAAAGSSLGGVLYPIIFYKLQPLIGFGWTTRTIGFIVLGTQLIPNLCMKVRVLPASKRKIVDWSAFTEPPYALFVVGAFLAFMGLYTPFFYIQLFAIQSNITDTNLAFYLLPILNASSIFGRIFPNMVADRVGPFNIIVLCAVISGILALCLNAVSSIGSLIVFCILYGFFSGSFVSLPPTILVALSPNRGIIGTRMGMNFACVAVGVLIGTPIAGAILDTSGFTGVWVFGGVLTVVGGCVMAVARVCKIGWKLTALG
ncbi:hypothetical protein H2199_000322 [Coniosporium tulheliwenetii]|uniref:Uncharacterized protein n=1 Tax=Coniosporium tulheliwenetii TaxID=3383036 RepID=A0ACC2ZPN8_9PEZI|nr:hypothetical protein H2199_000322 [Cladosporium sp. JES 115]